MIRMTRTPDKGWSRVSIVEFIVENNVEYYYSTKYSTMIESNNIQQWYKDKNFNIFYWILWNVFFIAIAA